MEHEELTRKIDAYLEENWETMVEDIETLVRIPSFEESDKATEGAPFGPGPKEALEAALEMASDMGFKTHDAEGYIGFADFPGTSETQLGIIANATPKRDYYVVSPHGRRQVQLALGPKTLAFVGHSDKESIARIQELSALHGPRGWQETWLRECGAA